MSSRLANMKASVVVHDEEYDVAEVPEKQLDKSHLLTTTGLDTASEYQIDIFDHLFEQLNNYKNGQPTSSLAVRAVAGSGKTTTIVAAAKLVPSTYRSVFLAFNKSIADELGSRLPKHVWSKTLNSLGFGILRPYLAGIGVQNVKVYQNRTDQIMRNVLSFQEKDDFGSDVKFLVGMCKAMGVVPVGVSDGQGINGMQATDDVLTQICVHNAHMIDVTIRPTVYNKVREILAISFSDSNIYETGIIDFDDQKWLTVCKRPNGRSIARASFDVIFIDEVQDVNGVDIELINMVLKNNGIVVGVGDDKQAIYGFRGADTQAFNVFQSSFNADLKPLSITYRCGKALVRHAQQLVPFILPWENAAEGEVAQIESWDADTFNAGDLVLCRNNAPLIRFAYTLIKARKPVYVKGRNIGDGLVRLINDLVAEKIWVPNPKKPGKKMPHFSIEGVSVTTLATKLREWENTQKELIRQEDPDDEAAIQRVVDQADSVRVFLEANVDGLVTTVATDINSMFSDEARADAVVCSTIHKAKGLEADRVFMYRYNLMYPFYITPGTWQHEQEINLDYVARTRGKSFYGYLHGE